MNNINYVFLAAMAGLFPTSSHAEISARTEAHATRSLATGVGVDVLPTFERKTTDMEPATKAVLARICRRSCGTVARQKLDGGIRYRGPGWRLDVHEDGTAAEFTDELAQQRARELGVAPEAKLSLDEVEVLGRRYIAEHLAPVIALQPGETLVARRVAYRTEGGVDRNGTRAPDLITGQRVLFTREIGGRPVLGPGSKVTITFLSDGSVESFRYDWSTFVPTGTTQRMLGATEILQRVQRVTTRRMAGTSSGPLPAIASASRTTPLELGNGVELQRLECGYYDPGVGARGKTFVLQAGCYYHAVHRLPDDPSMIAGLAGAVPAAVQPVPDEAWIEERALRGAEVGGLPAPGGAPGSATPSKTAR